MSDLGVERLGLGLGGGLDLALLSAKGLRRVVQRQGRGTRFHDLLR
jgi:hypothetical protein